MGAEHSDGLSHTTDRSFPRHCSSVVPPTFKKLGTARLPLKGDVELVLFRLPADVCDPANAVPICIKEGAIDARSLYCLQALCAVFSIRLFRIDLQWRKAISRRKPDTRIACELIAAGPLSSFGPNMGGHSCMYWSRPLLFGRRGILIMPGSTARTHVRR